MSVVEAIRQTVPALIAGAQPAAIVPTDLDQVWRLAGMIHKAGMAPKDMETPEKISVALLHGLEIGLKPMQSMQRIAVINGRPAIWGDAVIGLVRASGLAEYIDEEIIGEGEQMVAVCKTKRKGEKKEIERSFSVADARRAGLWDERQTVKRRSKNNEWYDAKNDSPWFKYPKRMLQMRARVALRDAYADVLGGMYIAEELLEGEAGEIKDVTPKNIKKDLPAAIERQTQDVVPTAVIDEAPEVDEAPIESSTVKATKAKPLPPMAKRSEPIPVTESVSDFPGDKEKADSLDIPPYLQRNKKPDVDKPPREPATDDEISAWLNELGGALSGCTDLEQLTSVQNSIQLPMKGRVPPNKYAESQTLVMDAYSRISEEE